MWMSNDRVPLENIESPYGGGVLFPVAPVLLTYPKQSALGVSLDSGLMEGMSRPEPLEQSVLGALSVVQPDETDTPERPALPSQMNHEQSRFKSSAGEFSSDDELGLEILEIGCAAVSAGGNIRSTASEYVIYPPHPSPFEQGALDVNRTSDNLDSCGEPHSGSDSGQSSLEWEDVMQY